MYCLRLLLFVTCKHCCLQTCNYDQSLVVMDTNTPTKFQLLMGVEREEEEEEEEEHE